VYPLVRVCMLCARRYYILYRYTTGSPLGREFVYTHATSIRRANVESSVFGSVSSCVPRATFLRVRTGKFLCRRHNVFLLRAGRVGMNTGLSTPATTCRSVNAPLLSIFFQRSSETSIKNPGNAQWIMNYILTMNFPGGFKQELFVLLKTSSLNLSR